MDKVAILGMGCSSSASAGTGAGDLMVEAFEGHARGDAGIEKEPDGRLVPRRRSRTACRQVRARRSPWGCLPRSP